MTFVSAVMPTRGRVEWSAMALECFAAQTYQNRELVILDDSDDPSFPDGIKHIDVQYSRLDTRRSIPDKRNMVNALSRGDVIVHWDSDDWSDPSRIMVQLRLMEESRKSAVGFNSMLFYDTTNTKTYKYVGSPDYALGTSLCYRRDWWKTHQFPSDKLIGSDNSMVRMANTEKQLSCMDVGSLMVARIHSGNTSSKQTRGAQYRPWPELPAGFKP